MLEPAASCGQLAGHTLAHARDYSGSRVRRFNSRRQARGLTKVAATIMSVLQLVLVNNGARLKLRWMLRRRVS
jgi:hypothetical protein